MDDATPGLALEQGVPGRYYRQRDDGRLQCELCPRDCVLSEGQRGLCFVRRNVGGRMHLTTYGRSSGFCIDPIEKKPLNHFFPGSSVLSLGTAGCNLTCKFCQNWEISKSRSMDRLQRQATPESIAAAAIEHGCRSVATTYNDPVIFAEYAIDIARACRERGVRSVAVTAGYIHERARQDFFAELDAVNIDLKAFSEEFYQKLCSASLQPVLETIEYVARHTDVWLEVTTLLIPGHNDSSQEIARACQWLLDHCGAEVPVHFSAFHPDFRMADVPRTPLSTLERARRIAQQEGLQHVYTGNVRDLDGDRTRCSQCARSLIQRDWYQIVSYDLRPDGTCPDCGQPLAGRFDRAAGSFGRRRLPVRVGD